MDIWSIHRLEQFPPSNIRIIFWLHNIEGWPTNILYLYWYISTFYERNDSLWMKRKCYDIFILIFFISGSNIIYLVLIITLQLNTKHYWDTLKRTKQIKSQIRSPILLRKNAAHSNVWFAINNSMMRPYWVKLWQKITGIQYSIAY